MIAEVIRGLAATSPLVSVVISTKDRASMVIDAAQAVLDQDLDAEFELIVCDNASGDGTDAELRRIVSEAKRSMTYIRMARDAGAAGGRNAGLSLATGRYIAFTDSDCIPSRAWLRSALAAFASADIGVVQGRTVATESPAPLFEHHAEVTSLSGTFATANVVYRREALGVHRFDPGRWYSEDIDLGWRVVGDGWGAAYSHEAVVAHRVIRITPLDWILWPTHYVTLPGIAARYPGFRRHLVFGVWVDRMHLAFDLALLGAFLVPIHWGALSLALPYAIAFARTRGLRGRFPPAKAVAHIARDAVAFAALAVSSARSRALVL